MSFANWVRPLAAAVLVLTESVAAAGPVEDGFKNFIESLRASGKDKLLQAQGNLGAGELKGAAAAVPRTDSLPLGQDHLAIFVTSSCGSCAKAVEQLRAAASCKKGAGFGHFRCKGPATIEVLNLTTSATAREAFQLVKAKGVPAVLTPKHLINGYSDAEFKRVRKLELESLKPDVQATERQGA